MTDNKLVPIVNLSELMIARLIHDIVGPVGAVSNGLEYITDEDATIDIKEQALELAMDSAEQLVASIQYFRLAYGFITPSLEITIPSLKQFAENFFVHQNTSLSWEIKNEAESLNSSRVKLLLNLLLIANSWVLEGVIRIVLEDNSSKEINITVSGDKILLTPEAKAVILGKYENINIDSKNIQLRYVAELAENYHYSILIEQDNNSASITAKI